MKVIGDACTLQDLKAWLLEALMNKQKHARNSKVSEMGQKVIIQPNVFVLQ